jgi:hypothetical protein
MLLFLVNRTFAPIGIPCKYPARLNEDLLIDNRAFWRWPLVVFQAVRQKTLLLSHTQYTADDRGACFGLIQIHCVLFRVLGIIKYSVPWLSLAISVNEVCVKNPCKTNQ